MRFTVNKYDFEKAIVPVSIIAQSKAAESTLNGIYIEASDGKLTLYCYDIEKGIKTVIDATVYEPGKIVADSQLVPIVHSMPDGEIELVSDQNNAIKLSCGEANFQILGKSAENYPEMPEIKGHTSFTMTRKQFKNIINKTSFCICKDDTNPILKGSLFEIKNNTISVCAIDGIRIAVRTEKSSVDNPDLNISFILPGRAQQNILRIMEDNDSELHLELGNKHLIVIMDNLYIMSRLLEGEFPRYERFIPEYILKTVVDRDALINSLERVAIINEKLHNNAKLHFENDTLKISCETEIGKVNDLIPVHMDGEAAEVLFKQTFLIEALKNCENEKVLLRVAENGRGMVIKATEEDENEESGYLYLVMPVRGR